MGDSPAAQNLLALRKPFPQDQVGKLPRGNVKLDYVGHADVTARLLDVDPEWNWEPLATENGLPSFDLDKNGNPVGLWIKLTVGGVTRLGYGSVPSDQRDAVKVLIGDALRNAAMRFGVALDLWAKGDRADPTAENPSGSAGAAARTASRTRPAKALLPPASAQELVNLAARAQTPEAVRMHYSTAGEQGWLDHEVAHPVSGEKVTPRAFLVEKGNSLKHDKSGGASASGARGKGDQ
jgi:hypothetical protein